MNRTCAIYDNNENYARRLMHAMSMKANQQFNIELFTQKDAFEKYLRDGSPTVAMVSESGFYDGISDLYDGSLVVLTEAFWQQCNSGLQIPANGQDIS